MNIAFLIGRIIFGGYWLMASFNHFKNLNYMSEYAKAKGTPSPKLAVAGTGVKFLEGSRRANEADRHDQLHEEYGACGGTLDVLAATASVADESRDRLAHTACAEAGGQNCG